MKKPKVSVIMPIYNSEDHIDRSIQSVLKQTLEELEIILVDDGSTDQTPKICDHYKQVDSRIRVIHTANSGSGSARNSGLKLATGEYIAFVESDDSIDCHMYESLYKEAIKHDADIVKCGFIYYANNQPLCEYKYLFDISQEQEVFSVLDKPEVFLNHPCIWAGIYKKEFLDRNDLHFIETPKASYSDYSWMMMTYAYAKRMIVVRKSLYFYTYDNPESSHTKAGELYEYMFHHAKESNRIIKEVGIFLNVRDYVAKRCYSACLHSAENVSIGNRIDCFEKLREVFLDLYDITNDTEIVNDNKSRIINSVLRNDSKEFYRLIENEPLDLESLRGKRLVIFGAGSCGLSLIVKLRRQKIPYIMCVDNNPQSDYNILSPQELRNIDFDYVVIAVADEDVYDVIKSQLFSFGIDQSMIKWAPYR